jgi:hypothetical protein
VSLRARNKRILLPWRLGHRKPVGVVRQAHKRLMWRSAEADQ